MSTAPRTTILVVVAAVAVALVALFTGTDVLRPGDDGTVEVAIDGQRFDPATFRVPAGEQVTLVFTNTNDYIHHLAIGRDVQVEDGRQVRFDQDLLAISEARTDPASAWIEPTERCCTVTVDVPAGGTVRLDLTAPQDAVGSWHVGCFIGPCDPELGLAGELIVEP